MRKGSGCLDTARVMSAPPDGVQNWCRLRPSAEP